MIYCAQTFFYDKYSGSLIPLSVNAFYICRYIQLGVFG